MRLGMREVPRTGAGLVRKAMRIARNSFEDDEASEADFSALARLHLDCGFSDSRTRRVQRRLPFTRPSELFHCPCSHCCFPALLTIVALASLATRFIGQCGGGQRKPHHGLIDYDEVSPSYYVYSRAFPVVRGKRARGTIRPRGPPVRPACHSFKWQLFSRTAST